MAGTKKSGIPNMYRQNAIIYEMFHQPEVVLPQGEIGELYFLEALGFTTDRTHWVAKAKA